MSDPTRMVLIDLIEELRRYQVIGSESGQRMIDRMTATPKPSHRRKLERTGKRSPRERHVAPTRKEADDA